MLYGGLLKYEIHLCQQEGGRGGDETKGHHHWPQLKPKNKSLATHSTIRADTPTGSAMTQHNACRQPKRAPAQANSQAAKAPHQALVGKLFWSWKLSHQVARARIFRSYDTHDELVHCIRGMGAGGRAAGVVGG